MEKYSDKAVLIGIRDRKDGILEYLYKELFPQIKRVIIKYGGDEQDARDLFQEGLIIIFQRLKNNDLVIKSSFNNYFIVLCKFIWFRQNNIKRDHNLKENIEELYSSEHYDNDKVREHPGIKAHEEYIANKSEKIFQRHYRKLPSDCKKVIKMFYRKKPFREIAKKMIYKNEDYARRKKYLCMQQLMKMIKEDPEYIELKSNQRE